MIAEQQVQQIATQVGRQAILSDDTARMLREQFPDIHFTYCMDDDIGHAKAVFSDSRFNLYLVDSSEHCLRLTNDHAIATGIVVAEIEDEE